MKLTFGADFEGWVTWKGIPVPVCGRLGGTKQRPVQFPLVSQGYMYQEDGASAEFNVPVCDSPADLAHAVQFAGALGRDLVREKFGHDHELQFVQSAEFPFAELQRHPQAMITGCDPDFEFDTGAPRMPPTDFLMTPHRFAGGHIHIGYKEHMLLSPVEMAGIVFHFLRQAGVDFEMHGLRRGFYPVTAFRPKPYGVEYRGLSSRWCGDPQQMALVVRALENMQAALTQGARKVHEQSLESFFEYQLERFAA